MKCRLLYLVGQLGPGGSEGQLWNLLKAMERERYQPGVVVWNYREDETYVAPIRQLGVPIFTLAPRSLAAKKMLELRTMVRCLRPEIAHSYSFYTNYAAHWATRKSPSIALGSVRGDWSESKKSSGAVLGNLSARWPGKQICNSFAAARAMRESENRKDTDIYVVRNGLDLQRFPILPLPETPKPCIVGIGSLLPYKRWDRLVRAAAALKQRGANFRVRIVGEGPARSSLEHQVKTLGVDDCVELVGHSNNIAENLAQAAFLAHTSDTEGCPNVIMEAMACGRAVVATDVGDVSTLVENGESGYIVPRSDEHALVERMAELIAQPNVCRRMGEVGSAKAHQEFGLDRLVGETLAAYRSAGWDG